MKKKNGFTLIELLAVIIILGILMIIAIPSVTKYINDSRKSSYVDTAHELVSGARNLVNEGKLEMYDTDTVYYIPTTCIKTENASKSPYGEFETAYVIVTYDGRGYDYYWESIDDTGTGMSKPICEKYLDNDMIETDLNTSDIKSNYSIGGRKKTRVYNSNCTAYQDSENTLSLESFIYNTKETNSLLITDDFGNIRYRGYSDVYNYLKFEDSNKKWRIVGIVDGKIKLVDSELYGEYSVSLTGSPGYVQWYISSDVNHWHDSDMMRELNGDYYDNLSDLEKKSILDFDFGLENATETASAKTTYQNERAAINSGDSTKKWHGKVASAYASDYLYSEPLGMTYHASWMSSYNWKFNTNSGGVSDVFIPMNGGWIGTHAPRRYRALPTVYIKSGLIIKSGDGKQYSPYVVSLDEYVDCN